MNIQSVYPAAMQFQPLPEPAEAATLVLGSWKLAVPLHRLNGISRHFALALESGFIESREKKIVLKVPDELDEQTRTHFAAFILRGENVVDEQTAFNLLMIAADNNIPGLVAPCVTYLLAHADPIKDPEAFTALLSYVTTIENVEMTAGDTLLRLVSVAIKLSLYNQNDCKYSLAVLECLLKIDTKKSEILDSLLWYYLEWECSKEGMDTSLHLLGHHWPNAKLCMDTIYQYRKSCSPSTDDKGQRVIRVSTERPKELFSDPHSLLSRLSLKHGRQFSCHRLVIYHCSYITNDELQALSQIWGSDVRELCLCSNTKITSLQQTTFPSLDSLIILTEEGLKKIPNRVKTGLTVSQLKEFSSSLFARQEKRFF